MEAVFEAKGEGAIASLPGAQDLSLSLRSRFAVQVELAYGRGRLAIEAPDHAHIIEPVYAEPHPAPLDALRNALAAPIDALPLRRLIKTTDKVVIVHCDGTRPMPNALALQAISEVLDEVGVPDSQVTLLNALGTHRHNTAEEMLEIVGPEALRRHRSVQACSTEPGMHRLVGVLPDGGRVLLHREYVDADVRILLGFIEPHFFAGFSGGPKLIVPGVAAQETIEHAHRAELVGHDQASWGVLDGNPLWETLYAAAKMAPPTFILNVALNRDKKITAVFAGALYGAHRAGVAYVRELAMRPADHPFDIVVTTNSGFPLDQNLYQTVKGMSAAARVTKPGGVIIMASACADGLPQPSSFAEIVQEGRGDPQRVLNSISASPHCRPDQWQAQVLAQVCLHAKVYLYSGGVTPSQARAMMLTPTDDISGLLKQLCAEHEQRHGQPAAVCVLPEGPQTIPYLR